MKASEFDIMFPESSKIGEDITPDEATRFYHHKGEVGEARQDRGTTITTYKLLTGETKEMVVHWYTQRKTKDNKVKALDHLKEAHKKVWDAANSGYPLNHHALNLALRGINALIETLD